VYAQSSEMTTSNGQGNNRIESVSDDEGDRYEDAVESVDEIKSPSDNSKLKLLPQFHLNELVLGSFLGEGSFCRVHALRQIVLNDEELSETSSFHSHASASGSTRSHDVLEATGNRKHHQRGGFFALRRRKSSMGSGGQGDDEFELACNNGVVLDRAALARACRRHTGNFRFAMKYLRDEIKQDPESMRLGLLDLMTEAKFLSSLSHPHIIAIHAISFAADKSTFIRDESFFLVVDKLEGTLARRIDDWLDESKQIMNRMMHKHSMLIQRISVAIDIASAMAHLHTKNIVYRDLKPENVGFGIHGDVKLFDFGMAKELPIRDKLADGTYKMSGKTGTLRYMAPEVLTEKPYNLSVDVYSFGILLWQICSLKSPFPDSHNFQDQVVAVVDMGKRPDMIKSWSFSLYGIMKKCWDHDTNKRSSFNKVIKELTEEVKVPVSLSKRISMTGSSKLPGYPKKSQQKTTRPGRRMSL